MNDISLEQLKGEVKKVINNPADLLPKKEVVAKDAQTEALGDLGEVIKAENIETEKIANAMIEDMKRARELGLTPQFRTDELATEGMQPIKVNMNRDEPGIDSAIGGIDTTPSEALDVTKVTSIKNYTEAPQYLDKNSGKWIQGSEGPRSIIKDNYGDSVPKNNIQNKPDFTPQVPKQNIEEEGLDPDNMSDAELKVLLGEDYIQPNNEQIIIKDESKHELKVNDNPVTMVKEETVEANDTTMAVKNDNEEVDYGELEDEIEYTDEDKDRILNVIKSKVREKLRPKELDLSSFTVANPLKVVNIYSGSPRGNIDEIDWRLPTTGVNITMRRFEGTEIVALNGNSEKSVRNANLDVLRLIYDHITNPTKPEFEIWIRTVRMEDMEHLYFAIFKASFNGTQYLPYHCSKPKCKNIDIAYKEFEDMIHFYKEEDKIKFYDALESKSYNYNVDAVECERVQINSEYCVDLKMPTLYDYLVEPTYLSKNYRIKHKEKVTIISYIANIYKIDIENRKLVPVDYTLKTDDESKIITNKYRLYVQFLNSLSSDEYSFLTSLINKLSADKNICTFVIPEHRCEECGTKIEEQETTALNLLFSRHQLAALANM